MSKNKKRLVLLDTHAILHRAYHALPDFSSSKGEPTGALYGLISMLTRIITDLKPDYIIAALDLPGPTHRHTAFEAYKATRKKAEDDLVAQIKRSRDVLKAFGIPMYSHEGFEADDVIGTVVEKLKHREDVQVIIASGDMDALQLVDGEHVQVYTLKKGINDTVMYDEEAVKARFGFAPGLLPDYKGLRGDPSDNIPGVKGIGEKTAGILISTFGTLENVYHELKKHPDWLSDAGVKEGAQEKLRAQEEQALLSKALAQIERNVPIDFKLPEKEWRDEAEPEKAIDLMSELEFRTLMPRVRGLFNPTTLTLDMGEEPAPEEGEDIPEEELRMAGLAAWVLDSSITEPALEDIRRVGKSKDFATAKKNILAEIEKRGLSFVYEKIEMPLSPVLRRMEERGVLIDKEFLASLAVEYHKELDAIAVRIYGHAGGEFNINSPKQLSEVLFQKLALAVKGHKKTAGGVPSTRESELAKMRELHPIIADVLDYRELAKLLSTYIDTIPTLLDSDNRLHTTFVQTGTTTGRLASQNPNLQNIPIKSDLGKRIRHSFVADEGFELLAIDYSQVELRIAAILSGDPGLGEIFKSGRDVHAEVAAKVFHIEPEDVSYEQRRRAKVINFGILYGMGVNSLRESLGTTRKEAQEFYNEYFNAFPRLAEYLDEIKGQAAKQGYTETLFGRRRYFEGIRSPIPYVRAAAERMAINAPMQGTQSDIVKLAMVRIDELLEKEGLREKAYLLLQVHDELLFEIEKTSLKELAPRIREIMEHVLPEKDRRGIPLLAKASAGKNWGELVELSF